MYQISNRRSPVTFGVQNEVDELSFGLLVIVKGGSDVALGSATHHYRPSVPVPKPQHESSVVSRQE
jgi:hypothetical protein